MGGPERRKGKTQGWREGGRGGKLSPKLRPREGRLARARQGPSQAVGPVLLPVRARSPRLSPAPRWPQRAASSRQVRPSTRASAESAAASGSGAPAASSGSQGRRPARAQPVDSRSSKLRADPPAAGTAAARSATANAAGDAQQDHRGQHPAAVRPGHRRVLRAWGQLKNQRDFRGAGQLRSVLGPSAVQNGAVFESWKGHRELGTPVAVGTRKGWENLRQSLLSLGALWAPAPGLWAPQGRGQQGAERIGAVPRGMTHSGCVQGPSQATNLIKVSRLSPPAAPAPVLSLFGGKKKLTTNF